MSRSRTDQQPAPVAERTRALKQALEDKGLLKSDGLETLVSRLEDQLSWHNGARVVARAWSDPEYRKRLFADGTAACAGVCTPTGVPLVTAFLTTGFLAFFLVDFTVAILFLKSRLT